MRPRERAPAGFELKSEVDERRAKRRGILFADPGTPEHDLGKLLRLFGKPRTVKHLEIDDATLQDWIDAGQVPGAYHDAIRSGIDQGANEEGGDGEAKGGYKRGQWRHYQALKQSGEYGSNQEIAARNNVTRQAVWKGLNELAKKEPPKPEPEPEPSSKGKKKRKGA